MNNKSATFSNKEPLMCENNIQEKSIIMSEIKSVS